MTPENPSSDFDNSPPSTFRFVSILINRWRLLVGLPLASAVIVAIASLIWPHTYTATTTFTPEAGPSAGQISRGLASLAGQFGLSAANIAQPSSDVFAAVLVSNEILRGTLLSQLRVGRDTSQATLLTVLGTNDPYTEPELGEAIRLLRRRVRVHVGARTGIVTLSVKARDPVLAAAIANRMIDLLNEFNVERRQSQSREQRRFAGQRLEEAKQELLMAEESYRRFLESNRRFSDSPLLSFQARRLEGEVQLRQEVMVTLAREFEEARIAEVRDTPVLTIIDPARPPDRRSSPRRTLAVLMALVVGFAIASVLAFLVEYVQFVLLDEPSLRTAFERPSTWWHAFSHSRRTR